MENKNIDQKHQEYYDAIWGEIEPSHQTRKSTTSSKPKKKFTNTKPVKKDQPKAFTVNAACPFCNHVFALSVAKSSFNYFSYNCPKCGKKVAVKTKFLSEKAKIGITLAIAIPAAAIFAYFMFTHLFA